MNQILHIFRKDAVRLWPQISAFLALLALRGCVDSRYAPYDPPGPLFILPVLLPIACSLLLIALIHQEGLVGDRKYWLSRPIARRDLVAAKILFALVFVNLPLFLYQAAVILAAGLPLSQNWPNLLCLQLFFTAVDILPIAALAAVTKSIVQTIMVALVTVTLVITVSSLDWSQDANAANGMAWIDQTVTGAIFACFSIAALALQYTRRAANTARIVVAAAAILTVISSLIPYAAKWTIQMRLSTRRVDPSAIRISWNPEDRPEHPHGDRVYTGIGDLVQLRIPVRIDNLPSGLTVQVDAIDPIAEGFNGVRWTPGWLHVDVLDPVTGGKPGSIAIVDVDRKFFLESENTPIRLHGVVNVTVLQTVQTLPLQSPHRTNVPGIGNCATYSNRPEMPGFPGPMTSCNSVLPSARLIMVTAAYRNPGSSGDAPYPASVGYSPLTPMSWRFGNSPVYTGAYFELQKPIAYIQRPFDFQNIRLSDYAMEPPSRH